MNPHAHLIALACATLATVGPGCSDTPSNPPVTDVPGADLGADAGTDVPSTDLGTDVPTDAGTDVPGTDLGEDASVTCGQAQGGAATGCAPASLVLDPAICRCILGYYWDGRECVSSANCRCLGNCEQLYPTREACAAAYARCG